jgi:hypothetical protein
MVSLCNRIGLYSLTFNKFAIRQRLSIGKVSVTAPVSVSVQDPENIFSQFFNNQKIGTKS